MCANLLAELAPTLESRGAHQANVLSGHSSFSDRPLDVADLRFSNVTFNEFPGDAGEKVVADVRFASSTAAIGFAAPYALDVKAPVRVFADCLR